MIDADGAATQLVIWTVGEPALAHEVPSGVHVDAAALPQGPVHALLAVLTYKTWARSRHVSVKGPTFVREAAFPWGLPTLSVGQRSEVETANDQLRAVFSVIQTVWINHPECQVLFCHPEDLGEAPLGWPASPWQLPELKQWARRRGALRAALFQCEFGAEIRSNPIGLLCSEPQSSNNMHRGWTKHRGTDNRYLGPLPARCNCGSTHDGEEFPSRFDYEGSVIKLGLMAVERAPSGWACG